MTQTPFAPVREDGRPYWQVIYDDIVSRLDAGVLRVGDVLKYKDIEAILGEGVEYRQPTLKAAKELREHQKRSLDNVRGVGYKIVAGMSQVDQAKRQQRKAHRGLVRSHQQVATVDHKLLDSSQSAMVDQITRGMVILAAITKRTADKVAQHEEEIALLKSAKVESNATLKATSDEVAELRRRLDALESQPKAD